MLLGDHLAPWSFDASGWEIRLHESIAAELSDFEEIEEDFEEFDEEDFDDEFDDDFEEELEDEYEIEADDTMLGPEFRTTELDAEDVEDEDDEFEDLDETDDDAGKLTKDDD